VRGVCGHDRAVLNWALSFVDSPAVHHCRAWQPGEYDASMAVHDPAALANIIVDLLTEQGVESQALTPKYGACCFSLIDPLDCDVVRRVLPMPQARAFALELLAKDGAS
jgi:hypothetical protein